MFGREVVAPGSTIHTDGTRGVRRLADMATPTTTPPGTTPADRSAVLPGVHLLASLLERWIAGTLHHRISNEQLPYYIERSEYKRRQCNGPPAVGLEPSVDGVADPPPARSATEQGGAVNPEPTAKQSTGPLSPGAGEDLSGQRILWSEVIT